MKKNLLALSLAALLLAPAANAVTVYDNGGLAVDFNGSYKLKFNATKSGATDVVYNTSDILKNAEYKLGVKVTKTLDSDLSVKFSTKVTKVASNQPTTDKSFAIALVSKEYGELTVGNQFDVPKFFDTEDDSDTGATLKAGASYQSVKTDGLEFLVAAGYTKAVDATTTTPAVAKQYAISSGFVYDYDQFKFKGTVFHSKVSATNNSLALGASYKLNDKATFAVKTAVTSSKLAKSSTDGLTDLKGLTVTVTPSVKYQVNDKLSLKANVSYAYGKGEVTATDTKATVVNFKSETISGDLSATYKLHKNIDLKAGVNYSQTSGTKVEGMTKKDTTGASAKSDTFKFESSITFKF